jgi:hypothetical protein
MAKLPSSGIKMGPPKAKKILSDGEVRGTPLTKPQRGLFGAIAGGAPTATAKPRPAPKAIGERPMLPRTATKIAKMRGR